MSETPKTPWDSLLSEIISASIWKEKSTSPIQTNWEGQWSTWNATPDWWNGWSNWPKKKKEPINPATFLKWIGAIFLVLVIFFWSFLAYIVFHPEQANFFVNIWGIDTRNLGAYLRSLINGSFGIVFTIISITWIIILFRAIWTPKEQKRKKTLSVIGAIFVGIILFMFVAFWAHLFEIFNKINWENLDGKISIYNNELLNNKATETEALITDTNNIIWPIDLNFEIWENARQIEKSFIDIESYEIDFDGAICSDGTSVAKWFDPKNAKWIVCTFDAIKQYKIYWIYRGRDRTGKVEAITMSISPIQIRWLLSIKKQKNRNNEDIITLDATDLVDLWNPRWFYRSSKTLVAETSITEKITDIPQIIDFRLFSERKDRTFVIQKTTEKWFTWNLNISQSVLNPLRYTFSIEGLNIDETWIIAIDWRLNDGTRICTEESSKTCEYTFPRYGSYLIQAIIETANGESYTLEKNLKLKSPLIVLQKARIKNKWWIIINTDDTYDTTLRSYVIKDIITPEKIYLDARDVVAEDPEFRLHNVIWTMSDWKETIQKEWIQQEFDLLRPIRYTMNIEYIFKPNVGWTEDGEKTSKERVIFDIEHKSLIPRLTIENHSDYVPVVISVDGSQSSSEDSEIKKFTYTFWEGKPAVVWDAFQQYEYKEAGEKIITLTITNEKWETASVKEPIVLKNQTRTIDFIPSISPWIVWLPVDFTPNTNDWNITDYIWTFWDNTPIAKEAIPSHIFKNPGNYTVSLTVVYSDGTRKETKREVEIVPEMQ